MRTALLLVSVMFASTLSAQQPPPLTARDVVLHVYPVALGKGKRVFPDRIDAKFKLASAHPYPTGVVGLNYIKES